MIAAATPAFALPSLPDPLTGLHALVAAGCAAIGVVLVLRGLRLSRWLMMAAGAVAGLILAGPLSARMPDIPAPVVRMVLAGSLAIIAFITARLWIGLLASALAGSITVAWTALLLVMREREYADMNAKRGSSVMVCLGFVMPQTTMAEARYISIRKR